MRTRFLLLSFVLGGVGLVPEVAAAQPASLPPNTLIVSPQTAEFKRLADYTPGSDAYVEATCRSNDRVEFRHDLKYLSDGHVTRYDLWVSKTVSHYADVYVRCVPTTGIPYHPGRAQCKSSRSVVYAVQLPGKPSGTYLICAKKPPTSAMFEGGGNVGAVSEVDTSPATGDSVP